MENTVQPESRVTESAHSPVSRPGSDRLTRLRQELEFLNTMGKRFVAAFDRFQVHRALLATLQELYSFSACSIRSVDTFAPGVGVFKYDGQTFRGRVRSFSGSSRAAGHAARTL